MMPRGVERGRSVHLNNYLRELGQHLY